VSKPPAISCQRVSFAYDERAVLREVSWEVPRGATVALVGPNGGGKSTLMKLCLGLLSPQAGEIRILDQRPRQAARRVGYMPQFLQFDPQFPLTVFDLVAMGRLTTRWPAWLGKKDRRHVAAAIEAVDLTPLTHATLAELSGGQRQRALIARALAVEPELLLLDEPTAMVDPHIETRLLERLRSLHRQMTIVIATHDIAFVSALIDEVACVHGTLETHPVAALDADTLSRLYGEPVHAIAHHHHHDDHA